jgi:hypothetical protein
MVGLPVVQIPPDTEFIRFSVLPAHTTLAPVIVDGAGVTLTNCVALHPLLSTYVILALPALIPDTKPVLAPTDATVASLLLQVPPVIPLVYNELAPKQIVADPLIAVGVLLTVNTEVVYTVPQKPPTT